MVHKKYSKRFQKGYGAVNLPLQLLWDYFGYSCLLILRSIAHNFCVLPRMNIKFLWANGYINTKKNKYWYLLQSSSIKSDNNIFCQNVIYLFIIISLQSVSNKLYLPAMR